MLHSKIWLTLLDTWWAKTADTKEPVVKFQLIQIQFKKGKSGYRNKINGFLLRRMTGRCHKGGFWGKINVYILIWVLVMWVCTPCKNPSSCTVRFVHFTVGMLCFKTKCIHIFLNDFHSLHKTSTISDSILLSYLRLSLLRFSWEKQMIDFVIGWYKVREEEKRVTG